MDQIKKINISRVDGKGITQDVDVLAVEDPVEIQVIHPEINGGAPKPISITMRTPGDDIDLALGFLFTEGLISSMQQIKSSAQLGPNNVWVTLDEKSSFNLNSLERNFYTTSSCGVCGKASIDAIRTTSAFEIQKNELNIEAKNLFDLQSAVLKKQSLFSETGGIHAAALFNEKAELIQVREDVGRHNALDKLIGWSLQENMIPLSSHVLMLSGRASFELLQKASMAGISIVVAVGAPSSLAVEVADELGITLVGFLKSDSYNIYTHRQRIVSH